MLAVAPSIDTRRARLDDLDALLANVQAGFDSYVAFAPPGWQAPEVAADRHRAGELLADPTTWALFALAAGNPIGHVAFVPGRERPAGGAGATWRTRPLVPGLAHLWQLFVLPGMVGSRRRAAAARGHGRRDARAGLQAGSSLHTVASSSRTALL